MKLFPENEPRPIPKPKIDLELIVRQSTECVVMVSVCSPAKKIKCATWVESEGLCWSRREVNILTHANSHCMVILANQYMEFATRSSTAIKIYPINLIHWLLSSRTLMCHGRTVLSCTLNDPSFAELIYDHISTLLGNVGVTQKCRPYTQILIKSHIHP